MVPIRLVDRVGLPVERRDALAAAIAPLASLDQVLRFGFRQTPPWVLVDIVVQDEYCHDVVMAAGDIVLVFDTT